MFGRVFGRVLALWCFFMICVALVFAPAFLLLAAGEASPAATAADWVSDPGSAAAANAEQAADLESAVGGGWWSWVVGGATAVLGAIATANVLPGWWQTGANLLWRLLSTAQGRRAADRERRVADTGRILIETIEELGDEAPLRGLKDWLERRMDASHRETVEEIAAAWRARSKALGQRSRGDEVGGGLDG